MKPTRQPTVTATLLRYLATASKHRVMYPAEHPIVKRAMDDLVQVVDLLLRDRETVTFQIYNDTFFLDNLMLPEESLRNTALLASCLERAVGIFSLQRGITAAEIHAFVGPHRHGGRCPRRRRCRGDAPGRWGAAYHGGAAQRLPARGYAR